MFLRVFSGFTFKQVAEIVRRKIHCLGTKLNRRNTIIFEFVRIEILCYEFFKPYNDIFILIGAGNKLSSIKTPAIIQQQFYV